MQLTHLKSRPITYASHRDAALFAFFGQLIEPFYEQRLAQLDLADKVIAYRSIEGKNNVDFALRTFRHLELHSEWAVICIDIKDFFGSIPHTAILTNLSEIMPGELPSEFLHVLNNLMHYRYVPFGTIIDTMQGNSKRRLIRTAARGFKICRFEDFQELINETKLIKQNHKDSGIPQGSPISGLIANIAMLGFDQKMAKHIMSFDIGLYQRYSDDIVLICPQSEVTRIYNLATTAIMDMGMKLSSHKTEAFARSSDQIVNITHDLEPEAKGKRQNIQYLGLEWNGTQIVLRPGTVGKRGRPKQNPKAQKFWKYHGQSAQKIGASEKAIKRQAHRMHKTVNKIQDRRINKTQPKE